MKYGHGEDFSIEGDVTEEPLSQSVESVDAQQVDGSVAQGQRHAWSTF